MSRLCIITARGGSKRIPRKNIREFCGKPIIAYSISAALESTIFDEVMVSTDDVEIAEIARRYGAAVPFLRSAQASDDYATTADVLMEVLEEYANRGRRFEMMCCLYPTAPFVSAEELKSAYAMLKETDAPSVVTVTDYDFPPQRAFAIREDGSLAYVHPEYAVTRSQDLPVRVHDCGRFYLARVDAFERNRALVMDGSLPLFIPNRIVQDIDTLDDWIIAEVKYETMLANRSMG